MTKRSKSRTDDEKALRRWINHYRQRRDPPGGTNGMPVGATSEEWEGYVAWVRAFGHDGARRHGDNAQESGADPCLYPQA